MEELTSRKRIYLRRALLAATILVCSVLQNTDGWFPRIAGAGALLLIPLTAAIAMFERDISGMLFGLFAGALITETLFGIPGIGLPERADRFTLIWFTTCRQSSTRLFCHPRSSSWSGRLNCGSGTNNFHLQYRIKGGADGALKSFKRQTDGSRLRRYHIILRSCRRPCQNADYRQG